MSTLFVANTGGHLAELDALAKRLPFDTGEELWVTFDDAQSRSILQDREARYVRYSSPRDVRITVANLLDAVNLHRHRRFDWAVSTGAGIAVSFLPVARAHGSSCHYIESAARLAGPSLTGRIMTRVPGMTLHCQTTAWAGGRWNYLGSVFDGFEAAQVAKTRGPVLRVVVSVGSSQTYPFRRLLDVVARLVPTDALVVWQTGSTPTSGLGIEEQAFMPALELEAAFASADVVIAHAGVGTALSALRAGRLPILVPRERSYGEHVDDHQTEIATQLASKGLATVRRVSELTREDILAATGRTVAAARSTRDLDLGDASSTYPGSRRP